MKTFCGNRSEIFFLVCSVVFVLLCMWYAVYEFGQALDGCKVVEVESSDCEATKVYVVDGRWNAGALEINRR